MTDTYLPLMKAVVARLKANATLAGIVSTRVYSKVPQDTTFPYVAVTINSAPYDGDDFTGMEHDIQVQCFSRTPSPQQAGAMRAAVYTALNRQESNLTLDSGTVGHIHYTGVGFIELEPDGITWQALSSFRCVVT